MGQHVDALARLLPRGDRLDQAKAVPADALVDGDVFLGNFAGARHRPPPLVPDGGNGRNIDRIASSAHFRLIAVGRVATSVL